VPNRAAPARLTMRLNDSVSGGLLVALGAAIIVHTRSFPPSPGQELGPGFFPALAAGGLAACGLRFLWSGFRQPGDAWLTLEDWVRRPHMVRNFVVVIADLVFYALVVDTVGFFLTAALFLSALFLTFGVRRRWIPVLAAGVTLALHFAFYTVLHVPLPWGWFEGIAW
jgi:putative tricarboxylic transport membrane protein